MYLGITIPDPVLCGGLGMAVAMLVAVLMVGGMAMAMMMVVGMAVAPVKQQDNSALLELFATETRYSIL